MIYLGVDVGTVRTGIAVCDKSEKFVFSRDVLKERNRERLVDLICEKAKEEKAEALVFGLPKNMDGTEGFKAESCKETAEMVSKKSKLPVFMYDERCTTVTAHTIMSFNGKKQKDTKNIIDSVAATVILEDFLKAEHNKSRA